MAKITLYKNDLPKGLVLGKLVAIDTESMGLRTPRDRLCLVQLTGGDGKAFIVHFPAGSKYAAPNLKKMLEDPSVQKIFHYARADVRALAQWIGARTANVYCTKIASRIARTYSPSHGLKSICSALLGLDISKDEQTSDWGSADLSQAQLAYAVADVMHLHELKEKLDAILRREGREQIAAAAFSMIPGRMELDLAGYGYDIFAHGDTRE
ncbi:3'-5' exonuclease [Alphaproteobacteria bacterium]|nr:3'-5' exonuclease [Alphaproteobacteria bacterium]